MYLKSLTLKGFKSFADRTVMRFEPGVAAVVGPNGSGKSNISDAVLWVLGELNAKNLRGQSMEDVIFSGSSARKPVAMAEVELLLDNSDGTLPVEFDEVSIGRRMYRSGESEYLINGTVMRRMDVLDILHDSGLGTGTHSIISQGHLDQVLSSKPEERRALIEEAAGVRKHKERKRKSENKLAKMDMHLARVNDITAEVERQLKPLKRKAQRAIAYEEVSAELSDLQLRLAVDDLRKLQDAYNSALEREGVIERELTDLQEKLSAAQSRQDELQRQMNSRGEAQMGINASVRRAESLGERFNSALMLTGEKRAHALSEIERSSQLIEENRLKARLAQDELSKATDEYEAVRGKSEAADALRDQFERAYSKNVDERNELRRRIDTLTAEQNSCIHRIETLQASLEAMRNNLSEGRAKDQVLSAQINDMKARLDVARATAAERGKNYEQVNARFLEAKQAETSARENLNRTIHERDAAREALDSARETLSRTQAERAGLEELEKAGEQANPALVHLLDSEGPFAQAVKPVTHGFSAPAELDELIESLLGYDMYALMVEDEKAARNLIDELEQSAVTGRAVFIPKDARTGVQGPEGFESLLSEIEVYPPYEQIVYSLLGDVYLAPSLDAALKARIDNPQPVRYATLDGFIVEPSGKIVFLRQSEEDRRNSALARRRALEDARKREKSCESLYQKAVQSSESIEQAFRGLQTETLKYSEQAAQLKGQAESAKQDADHANELIGTLVAEFDRLQEEYRQNKEALDKVAPSNESLSQELTGLQAQLASNRDQIAEMRTALEPLEQTIVIQGEEVSKARLDAAKLSEKCAYAQRMVATREGEIRSAVRADAEALRRLEVAKVVVRRVDPLNEAMRRLAESVTVLVARLEDESAQALSDSRSLREDIAEATGVTRTLRDQQDVLTAKASDLRVEKGRLEVKVEAAVKTIVDDCDTSLETAQKLESLEDRAEAEQRAASLERRIRNMGAINPDAAREYEEVNERYTYLSAQLADLQSARKALSSIIEIIDERMRDDFVRTFNQANDNFSEIYQILFPGGRANLSLVDPDDLENTGVEVNAQPMGKQVKKMSLLSGGEKSMTALALLFAVYRIRQTPFYILDEVEAALDDTNLRRLLAYVATMRSNMQFIMITHQRLTMETADVLYGVSMQADGVTKVISQKLGEAISAAAKEGSR